eukprot:COSAG02_NODE_16525_length_1077_cov_0.784254_1_plen_105_part_10
MLDKLASLPELPPAAGPDGVAWDTGEGGAVQVDWAALNGADPAADPHLSDRGARKRSQLASLLQIVHTHVLPGVKTNRSQSSGPSMRIVDFAAGTGHFGLLVVAT